MGVLRLANVTFKPNLQLWSRHRSFTHKVESCIWNCQSDSLHWEIPRVQESPDRPWMGIMQKGVHKEAINSKRKKRNESGLSAFHAGSGGSGLLPSASWKKLKTLSRLFHSSVPFIPTRADYTHSDPLSRFHPIFPSISPTAFALQYRRPERSELKAATRREGSSLGCDRKEKEWVSETKRRNHGRHLNNSAASDGWGSGEHRCENIANDS